MEVRFPKSSTDLYENAVIWEACYGSDFLFVTGKPSGDPVPSNNKAFSLLGNRDFLLSEKVAVNPEIPAIGLTPEQTARRKTFLARRENEKLKKNKYPTIADVREQNGGGKGVCLLSSGMEVFVAQPRDKGPEYLMVLFQRTSSVAKNLLTGPNGLASGPNTARIETIEELTFVNVASLGEPVVYALVFDDLNKSLSLKKAQENIIKKNLEAKGFMGSLKFEPLKVTGLKPHELGLSNNKLVLLEEGTNRRVDILCGSLGIEHERSTVIHCEFGSVVPPSGAVILVIDGEPYNRQGKLFDATDLGTVCEKETALSSLLGILPRLCDNWPRPVASHFYKIVVPSYHPE